MPRLLDQILAEWHLGLDGPPMAGRTGVIHPVLDADGVRRALKLGSTDDDNAGEIPTLQVWGGRGAVRLLRADPRRGVHLMEWLGDSLEHWSDAEAATLAVAGLYATLHRPAAPQLPDVHPMVLGWLGDLAALGRRVPAPPRLVEQALSAGRRLASEQGTHVLHGDLHYENVLDRAGEWVAIDPKGHNGDPCYELQPLLTNRWAELEASGNVGEAIRDRFFQVVDAAGLDERRCRDWVVVRSMISVGWACRPDGSVGDQQWWITRQITVVKAMQAVEV